MNIFKALFGGKEENTEEKRREEEARKFDVLKYDGVRALKMRQAAYAAQCFTHALDIKDDLECRDYLSQALIQSGDLSAAYEQLRLLAEAQPGNQQIFMRMAEVAYMMENYVAMADACEKAMLIDNSNPLVYYFYARACHSQGDDTNALAMLTKAVSLREDYYDAYLLRGEIRLSAGDVAEAGEDAAVLRSHVDDNEDVLLLAARVEMAKGEYARAIDIYDKVEKVAPFCAVALRERAAAKTGIGDTKGAEEDLKSAAELVSGLDSDDSHENQDVEGDVMRKYKNMDPYGVFS